MKDYDEMFSFFATRIRAVCGLEIKESFLLALSMVKACKMAFPQFDRDIRSQYVKALRQAKELEVEVEANEQYCAEPTLLEFRQSCHSQLLQKVGHKENYRFV
jgi:hypothetical protein